MDARDIIKRPVITEMSSSLIMEGKYTFDVDVRANKTEIKKAIEEIFGVTVAKVNVMNYKPKFKKRGKYAGYTNRRRKAIIKLTPDSKEIDWM